MTKEQIHKAVVVFLFAASAIGYLVFPSAMLSVVGIARNPQTDFLVRTLAAAVVALIPSSWAVRKGENSALYRSVIFGLAIYMFLSSAVDLHAYLTHMVGGASIPSIALRVLLGGVLLWLMPRRLRESEDHIAWWMCGSPLKTSRPAVIWLRLQISAPSSEETT